MIIKKIQNLTIMRRMCELLVGSKKIKVEFVPIRLEI